MKFQPRLNFNCSACKGPLRTHSNGYIKGGKYLFFVKVSAENFLLKLNWSCVKVDKIQKDHTYHTKQYQTFYKKIKCDLLNFREVQNLYHQNIQYLMVSIHFFHEVPRLRKVLCLRNCNHKKIFFFFFWWEDITISLTSK